jgi:hypothetical protein
LRILWRTSEKPAFGYESIQALIAICKSASDLILTSKSFFCKRTQILSNYQHMAPSPFATQSLTQTRRNTIDRANHAQHVSTLYPALNLSSKYHSDILHQYRQCFEVKYVATSINTELATSVFRDLKMKNGRK